MACMKTKDESGSSSGTRHGGENDDGGKAGGERKSQADRGDVCAYCGKKGHWAKECRKN
jgi:hypothetical protein